MNINGSSLQNMQTFSRNPDKYLLRVHHEESGISIHLMEKGFITWIKIHLGGLLGLFDVTSLKMQYISSFLLQVQSTDETFVQFNKAFLSKKMNFEKKHFPLFIPYREILNVEKLNFPFTKRERQLSKKIMNNIDVVCQKLIYSVTVNQHVESHITMSLSSLFIKKKTQDSESINVKNILHTILSGAGECNEDIKKVVQRGYKQICIHISPENNETISAKIFAL